MAVEKQIRIRIGASVDRSLAQVFPSIEAAAKKARKTIETEMSGASKTLASDVTVGAVKAEKAISANLAKGADAGAKAIKAGTKKSEAAFKELEAYAKGLSKMMNPGTRAITEFASETKSHFSAVRGEFDRLASDANRAMTKVERVTRRAAAGGGMRALAASRSGGLFSAENGMGLASAAMGGVAGVGLAIGRTAFGVGRSLLQGSGYNFDVSAHAAANTSLETAATQLSNAGYMPGAQGQAGTRVAPNALIKEVRGVANATAIDAGSAMEGLQNFVGKTGDLETGRAVLKDLAVLSKATGTNLNEMVDAAGDVANTLGDIPDKGEAIKRVMQAVAGQGKEGAVEIKDLASQMAKVAAAASQFGGGGVNSIITMSALAQEARSKGGAASATQAATSVMSFTNQFGKHARMGAFKKYGVETDAGDGKLRDANDIIVDALRATRGSKLKMGEMIADAQAKRVTEGFRMTYSNVYAKTQGTDAEKDVAAAAAVREEMAKLRASFMENEEISASFAAAMATGESQAQLFNNQMQETTSQMQGALLPAMKDLTPAVVGLTSAFAEAVRGLVHPRDTKPDELATDSDNQAVRLRHQLASGQIDKRTSDLAEEDERALAHQADIEQAKVNAGAEKLRERNSAWGQAKRLATGGIVGQMFEGQQNEAATKAQGEAENHLSAIRNSLDNAHTTNRAVLSALLNGEAKFKIVGPMPVKADPDRKTGLGDDKK